MRRSITGAMFYYHEGAYFTSEHSRARVKKWIGHPVNIPNEASIKEKFRREIRDVTGRDIKTSKLTFISPERIEYEISPLFFYCSDNRCGWNIEFRDQKHLLKYIEKMGGLYCGKCKKELVQSGHVFACVCTNVSDIEEKYCEGSDGNPHEKSKMAFIRPSLYEVGKWRFECKVCGKKEPLEMWCKCGERMSLKSTEGSGLTTPLSFTTPSFPKPKYSWIKDFFSLDIDELENIEKSLKSLKDPKLIQDFKDRIIENKVNEFIEREFPDNAEYVKERIFDYMSIYTNSIDKPKEYSHLGISFRRVDRINLVRGVYAYIVNTFNPREAKDFRFFIHEGKYNILTHLIEDTEGILVELDKEKVLEWLKRNEFTDDDPDDLSKWFIKKRLDSSPEGEKIKTLLHTISHGLIVAMSAISGVSVDAVSELLFPEIPACLIYTNYATSLGHLESLFENMLDQWIYKTVDVIKNCIHDPICIENDYACAGCLVINEVVCSEFNYSLDRRYVIGYGDIRGYWYDTTNL